VKHHECAVSVPVLVFAFLGVMLEARSKREQYRNSYKAELYTDRNKYAQIKALAE